MTKQEMQKKIEKALDAVQDNWKVVKEDFLERAIIFETVSNATVAKALVEAGIIAPCRCKDCAHSEKLAKHCEINRDRYLHCREWRGEETIHVWHKYKKYYADYSIVEADGYCDSAELRTDPREKKKEER